jgi:hypothetical protein
MLAMNAPATLLAAVTGASTQSAIWLGMKSTERLRLADMELRLPRFREMSPATSQPVYNPAPLTSLSSRLTTTRGTKAPIRPR